MCMHYINNGAFLSSLAALLLHPCLWGLILLLIYAAWAAFFSYSPSAFHYKLFPLCKKGYKTINMELPAYHSIQVLKSIMRNLECLRLPLRKKSKFTKKISKINSKFIVILNSKIPSFCQWLMYSILGGKYQ